MQIEQALRLILASYNGPLYHFLDRSKLAKMLSSDTLKPHGATLPPEIKVPKRYLNYINDRGQNVAWGVSMTRSPTWKPNIKEVPNKPYWGPIRITFDGARLSNKFKTIAYNDFWALNVDPRVDPFYDQMEELILTTKLGIVGWQKYVEKIDILEDYQVDESIISQLTAPVVKIKKF